MIGCVKVKYNYLLESSGRVTALKRIITPACQVFRAGMMHSIRDSEIILKRVQHSLPDGSQGFSMTVIVL
ncbi:MAG: hypothetical protein ACE5GV_02445 [Candidatus Scalindua sp.]